MIILDLAKFAIRKPIDFALKAIKDYLEIEPTRDIFAEKFNELEKSREFENMSHEERFIKFNEIEEIEIGGR